MKLFLRLLAVAIIGAALGYWVAAGANRGWNKNQVPVKTVDEVTGLEGVAYQKRFVPGAEFLAMTLGAGIFCGCLSFLIRTKPSPQTSNQQKNP